MERERERVAGKNEIEKKRRGRLQVFVDDCDVFEVICCHSRTPGLLWTDRYGKVAFVKRYVEHSPEISKEERGAVRIATKV